MRVKISEIFKQLTWVDWLLIGVFCAGLLYLIIFGLSLKPKLLKEVEFIAAQTDEAEIWVDVSGAVAAPGVYRLTNQARIKDALVMAGGLIDKADRNFVERAINLAQKVKDGDKIYIPAAGETNSGGTTSVREMVGGLTNLNKASKNELIGLPEIGDVRAQAIIDGRPYASVDDLVVRKVVTQKVFDKIKDKVTAY